MEVAAALTDKAHSVSVIGIESVPFKQALGEKVGKAIMKVGAEISHAPHPPAGVSRDVCVCFRSFLKGTG